MTAPASKAPIPQANIPQNVAISTKSVGGVAGVDAARPPLRTKALNRIYVGEDAPGNRVWPGQVVTYFKTEAQRAPYKLEPREVVINGRAEVRLFDSQGRLFDTRAAKTVYDEPCAIFVMSASGELYASNYQRAGEFHHSSLLAGEPVAAAGELTVVDGRIIGISNRSGHYWPDDSFTDQALDVLRSKGMKLDGVHVRDERSKTERVLK